jgi:dTDP-6-deoxy-L-talose 4-dehydrogenase (NAD+)
MTGLVLLTGATGFVGRQVLRSLNEQGVKTRLVVREGSEAKLPLLSSIETLHTSHDIFEENIDWWANACKGVDTVIHVAWYAEPGKYLQSERNLDCLIGTLNLAKGALQQKVRRFIGIGTCFEYDLECEVLSVETPLKPLTPYAGAKAAAFMSLSQCLAQQGIEFAWCRLFYLYGEGEDARRLAPYVRSRLEENKPAELTSGHQVRDFLDVRKAGEKIVEVAMRNFQGPVNICSGKSVTVRQFVEQIADEYGRRDLLRFGVRADNLVDPPRVVGIPPKELK